MATESRSSENTREGEKKSPLFGVFGPKLEEGLPIQTFMKGPVANGHVTKRLKGRSEETVLSYLEDLSVKGGANDIVGKLLDAHQKELIVALTGLRASETMESRNAKDPRLLAERANEEVDISETVVEEIETFLIAIMNTEVVQYRNDPTWIFWPKGRNALFRRFKNRFLHTFEGDGALPEPWRGLFLTQIEKAFRRVHKNHPVRGFLWTILFEIKKDPSFIEIAPWTGMWADVDESLMEIIRKKAGDSPFSENRFWFCRPSVQSVSKRTECVENSFFFSVHEGTFNAEDQKGGHFGGTMERKHALFYDNAGSYSYYDDSLFGMETKGTSEKVRRTLSMLKERDDYLGPIAYSYGNRSFRLSHFVDGFRYGDFDSCFMDSEWRAYKPLWKQNAPLFGSILSSGAKKNFVHPWASVSPKCLTNGAFDYSEIMDGFSGTSVEGSLKECTIVPGWGSGNIGEGIVVPEKMKDGRLNSDALKNSIVIGENTFLRWNFGSGLKNAWFFSSCKGASFRCDAAMGAVFYKAACGASFSGESGAGAKICNGSLLSAGTKISGFALQHADLSWTVCVEAEISEEQSPNEWAVRILNYPLNNARRVDSREHVELLQAVLEKKIHALTKSITSWAVARNDAIENAILAIPFGGGDWNSPISKEESVAVKTQLKWLLSSKFKETEKERKNREELKMAVQDGSEEWVREARRKASEAQWKALFESLLANAPEASKTLERFPAEIVLLDGKNWTSSGENGAAGISERAANYAIEKIKGVIHEAHRAVSEERKRMAITQLCATYSTIAWAQWLEQYSFGQAKFNGIDPDFWKNFAALVGSSTVAKRIELANAPKPRSLGSTMATSLFTSGGGKK